MAAIRVTRDDILMVRDLHQKYPDLPNELLGKMMEPKRAESTVGKILAGEYDRLLEPPKEQPKDDESVVMYQLNRQTGYLNSIDNRMSNMGEEVRTLRNQMHAMQDGVQAQLEVLTEMCARAAEMAAVMVEMKTASANPKWKASANYASTRRDAAEAVLREVRNYLSD